ncbi:cilia- and flagella-associated protein 44 [Hylaeus volcanicus]|uniref:cilia- and flagella-associated protein 44 n=1 Tax=Hylaeus volcanicus TaxID=313075 RepID=UPI0023B84A12|nr:cilia- and flagella-associated protein 44 [Hylaeus volcanicus]
MAEDGGKVELKNDDTEGSINENENENENFEINDDHELNVGYIEEYSYIARKPENGTVPQNILEFFHSYAYNCRKYFNLCVADTNTIIFASGNLIHFFNAAENKVWFRRGSMGGGIGHISKNPTAAHIAVGENGTNPLITIYNWPSMKIVTTLKGGTTKRYFHLTYSPDGLLLTSQGGEPDYYISLWNWRKSQIILQCKSHVQDIHNVTFSKYIPGQLTSCGTGHIKFWKVSKTFTGLKLKGVIGKFGNTEISDIIAIHPMPNETVVSGCEWGNILLWDKSIIKLEASRKNKQPAHAAQITQFEFINGELISVGSDGWIRFWFYETIEDADLPSDEQLLEIQPIYEFHIAEGQESPKKSAMLMSIQKQEPDDPEKTIWYAQDGHGGLWLLDLSTSTRHQEQKKIFTCHAGPIVDMDTAEWGPFVATLDETGQLHIYDYIEKKLNVVHTFHDIGTQIVWLPCKIDKTGLTLVCAFKSGVIRMITIAIKTASMESNIKRDYTRLIQVLKPHSMPISVMTFNVSCSLLVTGSKDATIFTFSIHSTNTYPKIVPIGYVKVPSSVTCMTWHPQEEATLLIGCAKGDCIEISLPIAPQSYTTASYELVKCNSVGFKFESIKSSIEREILINEYTKEKDRRLVEKKKKMEELMAENPHAVIDEEAFLESDDEDMILPEIYIPEIPNEILVAEYNTSGNIWLLMAGFDAGYVYEYLRPVSKEMRNNIPVRSRLIEHAKDTEIHNCLFYKNNKYLFLGTQYGELYVCKMKEDDPLDFSNSWILPIHDYYNGHISKMLLSYNKEMLLTCGHDGNIFSFTINDDLPQERVEIPKVQHPLPLPNNIEDIEDANYPNLEEVITQMERNKMIAAANKKKKEILLIISGLTEEYVKIIARNKSLLPSQQIPQFVLDPRIVEDLEQYLNGQIALTQQKLEFQEQKSKLELQKLMNHFITPITHLPFMVYSILNEDRAVHSLRELKLNFDNISKHIATKHVEEQQRISRIVQEEIDDETRETQEEEIQYLEGLLAENYSDLTTGLGLQINQMLLKYKEKKRKLIQRQKEWQKLYGRKPNLSKSRIEDASCLEETKRTIGEYNLKMSTGFNLTMKKETTATKYKQLLDCRNKLHSLREDFNAKLNGVRSEKQRLQKEVMRLMEILKRIHAEIPLKSIKPLPQLPKLNFDTEFPEHSLELERHMSMSEKVQHVKRQRLSISMVQQIDPFDLEYEVLFCDDRTDLGEDIESVSTIHSASMKIKDHSPTQTTLNRTRNSSTAQTLWEREMKRSRMWRKIYEQDCILRYINDNYEHLERKLDELEEYRLDVIYQSTYMNLNLLTLYEEFIVLKESESMEYKLEEEVNQTTNKRVTVMLKMQTANVKIATREDKIRKLQTKIKDVIAEFTKAITGNKFHDFLQKVFKTKYKAARQTNGSLDSVTQSSDTSSEDTDTSVDSDTKHIPFDENICPPGCDKQLYDMAFSMREKRYMYELQIKEEQREIEILQKELDTDSKNLRVIENNLKSNLEDLEAFMLENQRKLNNIDVTVVLRIHQLQHISDSGTITAIEDSVIFNKKELSNLYARVGILQRETCNLEEERKKSEAHLKRIKLDLKYMETQNKKLETEIKEKMIEKFGRKVSLISLFETVLQRLIYDTKTGVRTIMKNFIDEVKNIKQDCSEQLRVLADLIRNNTEKVNLLTLLEQEKFKLKEILNQIPTSEENMLQIELEHEANITALESILQSQIQQKRLLQYDVENLKTGPRRSLSMCLKESVP